MEDKVIKEIESGKYSDCYIIYNRKSTDEPNSQQNSLSYQRNENVRFAKKDKLKIADITISRLFTNGIITEKHSSFKEDELMVFDSNGSVQFNIERPKFYKMVEFLNKKLFKGVIFLSWDRASRNPTDSNILKKLKKNGIDLRFSFAKYEDTSSGALHMDIDGMFSEHHSRVTSEKVSLALKKNREAGKCSYTAPVGYLNEGNVDHKPFDPVRAPFVKRFFELADEGWSLADIAKWANEHSFTMPPRRKKRSRAEIEIDEDEENPLDTREKVGHKVLYTTIQPILRNRFYIGYIKGENKEWIVSNSHEPLIGEELFNRVQDKLQKKNKSKHYDLPLDFAFRNIFVCQNCPRAYNPYPKKGILYCALKCRVGCKNTKKNFNVKKFLLEKVKPLIQKLSFTEQELYTFENKLESDIAIFEKNRIKALQDKDKKKYKLREDLSYLRENKISLLRANTFTHESMTQEENRLESEISSLITEEQVSEEAMRDTMKDITTISELLKDVNLYWDFADLYEKEEIVKTIFSELSIFDNDLKYKLNLGLKPFESRFILTCARERT